MKKDEAQLLRDACHIVVATPGRLSQLVRSGKIALDSIRLLVFDEADHIVSMGDMKADVE